MEPNDPEMKGKSRRISLEEAKETIWGNTQRENAGENHSEGVVSKKILTTPTSTNDFSFKCHVDSKI